MTAKMGRWSSAVGAGALILILAGCTSVAGDYACSGGMMDRLKLDSGGKADVSMTFLGQKMEKAGTYTVDGDKVNVVIDGQSAVFNRSGKVLDGGDTNGKCTAQ